MYETNFHKKDLSNTSVLVTGGAGFIGSHIVEYLIKHKVGKVRVLDNFATGSFHNIKAFQKEPNFEFIEGDIRNLLVCQRACKGIEYVCHQAALGSIPRSVSDPITSNQVNVDGFVNLYIAAKDAGIKQFVYASSSSVYGDDRSLPKKEEKTGLPLSPYAASKYGNELYAHAFSNVYRLKPIGLRYFNVFGPRQNPYGPYAAVIPLFIKGLLSGEAVHINGDGQQTRDFTFIENVVQANIKALFTDNEEALNQVFNVAVGENYSVMELFNTIKSYLNSHQEPVFREPRKGDVRNSLADISKIKKLLDYEPAVMLKDGLERTIEYFKTIY